MRVGRLVFVLFVLALPAALPGCEDVAVIGEGVCGECGTIRNGSVSISGNAALDGIFKAVGDLNSGARAHRFAFERRVKSLAAVLEIETAGLTTDQIIAEIKTQFAAQIEANLSGGIKADYRAPSCSADIAVAALASAQCEAAAGCDVDVSAECSPGELSFACEGKCTGGCSGGCTGSCTAKVEGEAACTGTCEGACDLSVSGGGCEGTCKGECDGTCSLENASGECVGECNGTCTGSCEMPSGGGSCSGECKGECTMELTAEAECEGECSGSCSGECTGGCEGSFEPPSCNAEASANCEASADCRAQAEAQASASLSCTPPSLELSYEFSASLDASAQAEVMAKLDAFKVEMIGIIQGMFELRGLIEGNADLDIEPPVVTIGYAIEDFIEVVGSGEFEVEAVGLLPCVIPAFEESADVLVNLSAEMQATIEGQLELFALLDLG